MNKIELKIEFQHFIHLNNFKRKYFYENEKLLN